MASDTTPALSDPLLVIEERVVAMQAQIETLADYAELMDLSVMKHGLNSLLLDCAVVRANTHVAKTQRAGMRQQIRGAGRAW